MPSWSAYLTGNAIEKPQVVEAGDNLWFFALISGAYYYAVVDKTTGILVLDRTKVTVSNINALCPVYDGTNVWAMLTTGSTTVTSHKFTLASPGTAPTSATYQTIASAVLSGVDCRRLSAVNETAVVVSGLNEGTGLYHYSHSYLDPATGAARGSPAAVTTTATPGALVCCCPSILVSDGTTSWYYALWLPTGTQDRILRLVTVTSATLAAANATLATVTDPNAGTSSIGACCGYVADNGDRVVYAHSDDLAGSAVHPWNFTVTRYTYTGSTTAATFAPGSWLASKPAKIGTTWYVLTGYEDDGTALGGTVYQLRGFQRTYDLRDSDGNIVSSALGGEAGGLWHRGNTPDVTDLGAQRRAYVPAMLAIGNAMVAPVLLQSGSLKDYSAGGLVWDASATYGPSVSIMGRALVPGGIPVTFSHQENIREVTPLRWPGYITASATAVVYQVAVVYRFTSPDGTYWRSTPLLGTLDINNGATLTVPTLRHLLPGTTAQIEFYASTSGLPNLQEVKDNDPTASTITFTFSSTLKTDEALYTSGNVLVNMPAPACRLVSAWKGRAILSGCPERHKTYVSKEIRQGQGLSFNSAMATTWLEGVGDISACGPVNSSYLALFRRDAVAVLTGSGPNDQGTGNFSAVTLQTKKGTTNARGPVQGPAGCYYQSNDKRIYVVTGTDVADAFAGMEDYTTETVVASAHDEASRLVLVFTDGPALMALDYANPAPSNPLGTWYRWTSANLLRAYAACIDSSGSAFHVETTGALRTPQGAWSDAGSGAAVPVLTKVKTGRLAPVGLQGECMVDWAKIVGEALGACDLRLTVAGGGASTARDKSVTAGDLKLMCQPATMFNVTEVELTIEETANGDATEGVLLDGAEFDVRPKGRTWLPAAAERM
ncbi:MAG TPA: hypothetical protein VFV05_15535, partial [Methylomirabilota bacterium]|nr:hypothetical protein [Methylomirabilota bacterium]